MVGWPASLANVEHGHRGIPAFFTPNPGALWGSHAPLGVEARGVLHAPRRCARRSASWSISTTSTSGRSALTVGAVNVRTGEMRYFDSRDETLDVEHVMASGALPPAFPAVRIDGEPYWDGGIYSNTPIEAVLDDKPRRDSLIFAVNVWHPDGAEPESISELRRGTSSSTTSMGVFE